MTRALALPLTFAAVAAALAAGGCDTPGPATTALCAYCENDSQCGGNPCFEDVSGGRFCGAPCEVCPAGFTCRTVMGTTGLFHTCFPDDEACLPPVVAPGGDAGPPPLTDSGTTPGIIVAGPIGPTGGSVDRLRFGITGDTRPESCGTAYPTAVIGNIFLGMKAKDVQFAVDQGDHMFNCGFGSGSFAAAEQQMASYVSAAALLGKTVFMTMGNHECSGESNALCTTAIYGINPNYTAYMDALRPVASLPYYRFDVQTGSGLAAFVVVADDVWDDAEQSWLEGQLADTDAHAKYVFVSKHHPDGNKDYPQFQQIFDLVTAHHYTLFLTGHSHFYRHDKRNPRVLVIGCGGAPLSGGDFWGYGVVEQGTDDRIGVTVYDQATNSVMDQFSVDP